MKNSNRDNTNKSKKTLRKVLICTLLLLVLTAGGMMSIHAYFTDSAFVNNQFTVGNNTIEIVTLDAGVAVHNTGSVPCFVRVFAETETGTELTVVGSDWSTKQTDGYYYFEKALEPKDADGDTTTPLVAQPEGLIFYAESIQAEGIATTALEAFKN